MTAIAGRVRSTGFSVIGGSDLEQALTDQGEHSGTDFTNLF